MTMFLALGLAASALCFISMAYLMVQDTSDTRDDYHEGF